MISLTWLVRDLLPRAPLWPVRYALARTSAWPERYLVLQFSGPSAIFAAPLFFQRLISRSDYPDHHQPLFVIFFSFDESFESINFSLKIRNINIINIEEQNTRPFATFFAARPATRPPSARSPSATTRTARSSGIDAPYGACGNGCADPSADPPPRLLSASFLILKK